LLQNTLRKLERRLISRRLNISWGRLIYVTTHQNLNDTFYKDKIHVLFMKTLWIILIVVGVVLVIFSIIVGIWIMSFIGYTQIDNERKSSSQQETVEKNGITFIKYQGYWTFSKDGVDYTTKYNSRETEGISVTGTISLSDYKSKPLYFVGESNDVIVEINKNLNKIVERVNPACLSTTECTNNAYPIKDCVSDNIIIIKEPTSGENENIHKTDKCVYIIASKDNQIKYADRFIFEFLNI